MEMHFKELELDRREPFARGFTGECYRLDEETILKLYFEDYSPDRILREKKGARAALVAGVPTPISFHLVKAGNRYGVIYEMLKGRTISETVAEDPSRVEEMGRSFSAIARALHRAEAKTANLPLATELYRAELPEMTWLSASAKERVAALLDLLEQHLCYVHGDYNVNNVLITAEGPTLIDMGDFALGSPFLDTATVRFSFFESAEAKQGTRNSFTGMTGEQAAVFWKAFSGDYFGKEMTEEDARMLRLCLLIKKLDFEVRFGKFYPAAYREGLRRETAEAFEE